MWKIDDVEIDNKVVFAPMAGISNKSYRSIIKEMGTGLVYSEMISIMGIKYDSKKTIELLEINDSERPISIQIFGNDLNSFVESAKYIEENFKPDIIDINMGCPVPKVALKSQAGATLLKNPNKIYEIVSSIVKEIKTPVTVKIRSGWDESSINCVEIAKIVEKAGASAICIHPRTRSQGYSGLSNWEHIKMVKEAVSIPVIGNGDIKTIYDAKRMLDETNCDAIMIGRSSLGNPWFMRECIEYIENNNIINKPDFNDKLDMILKHFNKLKSDFSLKKALLEIRNHALWYIKGLPESTKYKDKFVKIDSEEALIKLIEEYRNYM